MEEGTGQRYPDTAGEPLNTPGQDLKSHPICRERDCVAFSHGSRVRNAVEKEADVFCLKK